MQHLNATSFVVEFVEDRLAAKDEQIGVLGDDALDGSSALQIGQLSISFIGSNDVVDACRAEGLGGGACP